MASSTDRLDIILAVQDHATAQLQGAAGALKNLALGYATFKGAQALVKGLVSTLKECIEATFAQEKADIALDAALKARGDTTKRTREHLQSYANEMMRTTNFVDDEVEAAQMLLITLGRLSGAGLDRATSAAADLAETLSIDLQSAATLVAKAAQGNTAMLGRYGIVIADNIPKSEKFAEVLRLIEERMGGRALAAAESFRGKLKEVADQWDEVQEGVGKLFTESNAAKGSLANIADSLSKMAVALAQEKTRDLLGQWIDFFVTAGTSGITAKLDEITGFLNAVANREPQIRLLLDLLGMDAILPAKRSDSGSREWEYTAPMAPAAAGVEGKLSTDKLAELQAQTQWMVDAIKAASDAGMVWLGTIQRAREASIAGQGHTAAWADKQREGWTFTNQILVSEMMLVEGQKRYGQSWVEMIPTMQAANDSVANQLGDAQLQHEYELQILGAKKLQAIEEEKALVRGKQIIRDLHERYKWELWNNAGLEIQRNLYDQIAGLAATIGATLVKAAFGAKIAWGDFFRQLIAQFIEAIIYAIILKIVSTAIAGASGGGETINPYTSTAAQNVPRFAEGGYVRAQHGAQIPGPRIPRDSVRAMLMPGEVVLRTPVVEAIERTLEGSTGGGAAGASFQVHNHFTGLIDRSTVEKYCAMQNRLAREYGLEVVATEVVG